MSTTVVDARCVHEWRWLPALAMQVDHRMSLISGENAECSKCGARTWAHGRHGNRPIITVFGTPTTEGTRT